MRKSFIKALLILFTSISVPTCCKAMQNVEVQQDTTDILSGGQYKIYHPANVSHQSGYLDVTGDPKAALAFLQSANFSPGDEYYENQLWTLMPIFSETIDEN